MDIGFGVASDCDGPRSLLLRRANMETGRMTTARVAALWICGLLSVHAAFGGGEVEGRPEEARPPAIMDNSDEMCHSNHNTRGRLS